MRAHMAGETAAVTIEVKAPTGHRLSVAAAGPRELGGLDALRRHWPEYLIEAAGLGLFMVSACIFATLLEHPGSPVRQAVADGAETPEEVVKVVYADVDPVLCPAAGLSVRAQLDYLRKS